jgi:hypothetical protein
MFLAVRLPRMGMGMGIAMGIAGLGRFAVLAAIGLVDFFAVFFIIMISLL